MPFNPSNSLLFIVTKLGLRVDQDLCIHYHVILNPWALLLSRWVSGLAQIHGNIVMRSQLPHQVVFGLIGCITPINPINKFGHIPCPMDTFYGNQRGVTTSKCLKKKEKKPSVRLNILDEGYPQNNEIIA